MVGEGVECATSMSMTLFSSLLVRQIVALVVLLSCLSIPVSEPRNTFFQFASGFEFRVCEGNNINVGKSMADERFEMLRKGRKGVIAALRGPLDLGSVAKILL